MFFRHLAIKNKEDICNKSIESWLVLTKIYSDLNKFILQISQVFLNIISPKLLDLNLELEPFERCLSIFSESIIIQQTIILATIENLLTEISIRVF